MKKKTDLYSHEFFVQMNQVDLLVSRGQGRRDCWTEGGFQTTPVVTTVNRALISRWEVTPRPACGLWLPLPSLRVHTSPCTA